MSLTMTHWYGDVAAMNKPRPALFDGPYLTNPTENIDSGFDSDRIGPYTLWQGNLKAELMVIGQDFTDVEDFKRAGGLA